MREQWRRFLGVVVWVWVAFTAARAYDQIREQGYEHKGERKPLKPEAQRVLDESHAELARRISTRSMDAGKPEGSPRANAQGNQREPGLGRILFQRGPKHDPSSDYTHDIFGNPLRPEGPGVSKPSVGPGGDGSGGPADRSRTGDLFRDDTPPGVYATRTKVIQTGLQKIGVDQVTDAESAAKAFAYLGAGTVEHFDALVTDANGKPLAIVGTFKGAHAYASAPIYVVMDDVLRVANAKNIWFAHNHPSGSTEVLEG
jgi:hypothetical protein